MEFFNSTVVSVCTQCRDIGNHLVTLMGLVVAVMGVAGFGGAFERYKQHMRDSEKVKLHRENIKLKLDESQWRMSSSGSGGGRSPDAEKVKEN